MKTIKSWTEFVNEAKHIESEVQKDVHKDEAEMKEETKPIYKEFFKDKLKKYGVSNIGELKDRRSAFFKEIKADWAQHKKVPVQKDELPKKVTAKPVRHG